MFLKKILGLAALGALLIVAGPAQQAQAATPVSPGIAVGQSDAGKLTTKVHHINGQPHHQSHHGRNLRHRQQHWRNHHHHYNHHHHHNHNHHNHHHHNHHNDNDRNILNGHRY
ncbi:hypothetical protein B2M20_16160 [Nitrobacter vulgaris]|uniref:Uncharacterized protein n=1 Tax=Nitrobacter vulgaris TaxID=29421 RepID=A0A1V4HUM8_NITVU|nr:hypothetical protein B2M20_16160 [Nitrobacter vulgaris]